MTQTLKHVTEALTQESCDCDLILMWIAVSCFYNLLSMSTHTHTYTHPVVNKIKHTFYCDMTKVRSPVTSDIDEPLVCGGV